MGCKLSKVVTPVSVLEMKENKSVTWPKRRRKVNCTDTVISDSVGSHRIVSPIDAEYGIYTDDSLEDLGDHYENLKKSNVRIVKVRPMAAKGERTLTSQCERTVNMRELNEDVEGLISLQPSSVNYRDRRFRPKAARGNKTPSWSSTDRRYMAPVEVPEYRRQAVNERQVAMFQANCLEKWMERQVEKERRK